MTLKTIVINVLFSGIFLVASLNSKGQIILTDTSNIKYLAGSILSPKDWMSKDFDDSNWSIGKGIIGYGDSASTKIKATQSLYVRTIVNIEDKRLIDELVFLCDFDDGFVAYANGIEFARVNMGKFASKTKYIQLADRSHELRINREVNRPVLGYYIDKAFINDYLTDGENVISIEVHNDSINGSDLNFWGGHVLDITNAHWNLWDAYARYKKCTELDSTHLPIIKIETDEFGVSTEHDDAGNWIESQAEIRIINNPNSYNKPTSTNYEHKGNISIRLRGASSSDFQKRQYNIELHDHDFKDTSVALLGMPKEADWVLQGPFADKSQIRNALVYEWGRKSGFWAPKIAFCELIMNGEYVGLYNLVEKIKRDSNRINIAKLRSEEISGTDLTGGYIFRFNSYKDDFEIVYPKEKNLQPEQETYIREFYDEYLSVLNSDDADDPINGIRKYIDEKSLINFIIISELSKEVDAYYRSAYMFKDKDDRDPRIKFGPLWDFDLSMGNSDYQMAASTDGWQWQNDANKRFNIDTLFKSTRLVTHFGNRWFELRKTFLHTDSIMNRIDALVSDLEKPIDRNYEVWPVINKDIFFQYYEVESYNEEINHIKSWLRERAEWIDNNIFLFDNTRVGIASSGISNKQVKCYPNPVRDEFTIEIQTPITGELNIRILNSFGQEITIINRQKVNNTFLKETISIKELNIKPGVYYCITMLNKEALPVVKVVVQ